MEREGDAKQQDSGHTIHLLQETENHGSCKKIFVQNGLRVIDYRLQVIKAFVVVTIGDIWVIIADSIQMPGGDGKNSVQQSRANSGALRNDKRKVSFWITKIKLLPKVLELVRCEY